MKAGNRRGEGFPIPQYSEQQQQQTATVKMPHAAVHKSKDKKRKGAAGAEFEYARRLQAVDGDDVPIGRITKMLRADRFMVTFYDADKKQIVEVQAGVVDRNVQRLKPNLGSFIVPVESGKNKYEIFMVLSDEDARRRSDRVHKSILNFSYGGGSTEFADCGIDFEADDDETSSKTNEDDKTNKKDKVGKHVERVLLADEDVNVDAI